MTGKRHGGGESGRGLTRRQFLAAGAASGVGVLAAGCGSGAASTVAKSTAVAPAGSDLGAVEHVIFLMMENRSFDHYYGTYPGVRGFDDHPAGDLGAFSQACPSNTTASPRAAAALPSGHRQHGPGRLHVRSDPQLGAPAPVPEQGEDGLVRRVHTESENEGPARGP